MLGPKVPPPPTPEPQLYSNLHVRTITPESSQPTQSYVFLSVHGSSEKRLDFTRIVTSEPSHPTLLPYPFLPVRCSSEKRLDLSRTVTSDPSHPTLYYITLSSRPLFIGETPRFESNRHIRTVTSEPSYPTLSSISLTSTSRPWFVGKTPLEFTPNCYIPTVTFQVHIRPLPCLFFPVRWFVRKTPL